MEEPSSLANAARRAAAAAAFWKKAHRWGDAKKGFGGIGFVGAGRIVLAAHLPEPAVKQRL